MKNQAIKGVLSSAVLFCAMACNAPQEQPAPAPVVDKEAVKKEIQAKENEFADTYNAGEMKSIGYYADDAVSFAQNQQPLVGKPAIIEYLKGSIDSLSNTNKISFTTNEVFVSNDGNQVVELGYFKVVDTTNAPINTGNYMVLFEKRDGKYVSVREMSASDMPLNLE